MTTLSWRWIFWTISVLTPIMIVLVIFGIARQPLPQPKPGQPAPSWRGFLYASLGAALLYGALDQGVRLDWWRSGTFVAMVVTGMFLALAAVVRHFSRPNPLVNFPFLLRSNTLFLGLIVCIFRFVLLASVVLIPSYLAAIKGYRPEQTGPVLLWLAIPQILAGLLAVYLLGRVDSRLIMTTGFALVAAGCLMNAQITSAWSGNTFYTSQLVLALGEGFAFNGMVGTIVLDILNSGSIQNAAAVLSFGGFFQTVRLIGGELGASFIQFFLHSRQVFHFDVLAAGIQGGSAPAVARARLLHAGTRATAATLDVGLGRSAILLGGSVQQQAFTQAVGDAFILIAYVATGCLLIVVCLKTLNVGFKQIIAASAAAKAGA
jgi:DHA2 family multidrug resistance protein